MKRVLAVFIVGFIICTLVVGINTEGKASETRKAMQISVKANGKTTLFELDNSPAARDLYAQLPLNLTVENYSNNEKIFYPPEKLNTSDTPKADGGHAGTLAYYAPWGDVVMFYGRFGPAAGLYELGRAISGSEYIPGMSGTIQIEKVFESFIVSEFLKGYLNSGVEPAIYFWRDSAGNEIDIIVDSGDELIPVEIKAGQTIASDFFKGIRFWKKLVKNDEQRAALVYGGERSYIRSDTHINSWSVF